MPRPRQSRLVFFRVNYPHWWGKDVAEDILRESFALPAGKRGEYKSRQWYTGEFETLASARWLFKLGKVREDLTHGTVKIEEGHYVFPVEGEGPVVPTVRCLYDPKRNMLVAETSNEISWTQIKGSLEGILADTRQEMQKQQRDAGDLGQIILQQLVEKSDFYSWAKQVDAVSTVKFKFWPTNPNPMRSFEAWDKAQQEAKADETHLAIRSKADGLNVEAELVEVGISQVHAGYGVASASGKSGGVTQTWHSIRKMVMRVVEWFERKEDVDRAWSQAAENVEKEDDEEKQQ